MIINREKKITEKNHFLKSDSERKIDFLILHHIQANSAEDAISQLHEHQVSSHFLVDEAGKIIRVGFEQEALSAV